MTKKKHTAWRYGRFAETLCAWVLRAKGYRILKRDYHVHVGEIDIIARRGGTIAIVEVKARRTREEAAYALRRNQRDRIIRATKSFLQTYPEFAALDIRFDVMLVSPWQPPSHLTNAWWSED